MKLNIPEPLAEKMALFPKVDFPKMALEAIEKYVNENEQHLTFEEKVARRALMTWKNRI